jgi:hypothetical protein
MNVTRPQGCNDRELRIIILCIVVIISCVLIAVSILESVLIAVSILENGLM